MEHIISLLLSIIALVLSGAFAVFLFILSNHKEEIWAKVIFKNDERL